MKKVIIILSVIMLALFVGVSVNDIEDAYADGECAANCNVKKKDSCGFQIEGAIWLCWGYVEQEIPE